MPGETDPEHSPAPMSLAWYHTLRPELEPGHQVLLLQGGADYFPALIEAIDAAQTSVLLETYIFEDDASGRQVAGALARAADRGVTVNLVVDGFGTPQLAGEVGRTLGASKVNVRVFRPARQGWRLSRQRLRRMHRKLSVFDGHTAFVGGINVLDDHYDPKYGVLEFPRFDFAVRVRGPVVARIQLAMQRWWWELTLLHQPFSSLRGSLAVFEPPDAVPTSGRDAGLLNAMFVVRDNFRFRRTIEKAYLRAIGRARREVLIANAYFFPGVRFRRALLEAARRGVRVRLLLQGRVEYRLQHYASQALYDELLLAGIEIIEYKRSFLHAKVAVIDGWSTVGSSNIDPFSLLLAREANLVVSDHAFAQALRARIDHAISEGGEPVALTRHRRRAWPVRVMNWLAYALLRLGVAISGSSGQY